MRRRGGPQRARCGRVVQVGSSPRMHSPPAMKPSSAAIPHHLLISCDEALVLMASAPPAVLGAHCSLPSCNALDFLPIVCPHCSAPFCGRHAPPSSHSCPSDPSTSSLSPDELDASRADDQPSFRSLLPDPKRHKRETSEPSEEERVKKEGQQAALAKLKASFAKGKAGTTSTPPTPSATAKKPNPTLDLMRLKGRAVPADPKHVKRAGDVPMSDRLFLKVQHAKVAAKEPDVREVWVSKVRFSPASRPLSANAKAKRLLRLLTSLLWAGYYCWQGARPLCGPLQGDERQQRDDRSIQGLFKRLGAAVLAHH